jgi:hypothetical protein
MKACTSVSVGSSPVRSREAQSEQRAAISRRRHLQPVFGKFRSEDQVDGMLVGIREFCELWWPQRPELETFATEQLVNGVAGIFQRSCRCRVAEQHRQRWCPAMEHQLPAIVSAR